MNENEIAKIADSHPSTIVPTYGARITQIFADCEREGRYRARVILEVSEKNLRAL